MSIKYACNCQLSLIDDQGRDTCVGSAIDYSIVNIADLTLYGGSDCVVVKSDQDFIDAFKAAGHDIQIIDCVIELEREPGGDCPNIPVRSWPDIILGAGEEQIAGVCVDGNINYDRFIGIDLSNYGGESFVQIDNKQDIINAFAALGFVASVSSCYVTVQTCTIYEIPVIPNPKITITGGCGVGGFDFDLFDAIDLSYYGGVVTEVTTNGQIVAAFAALGMTVIVDECEIELVGWVKEYQDVPGCLFPRLHIVDENQNSTCVNQEIDYDLFDYIDLSPWGGGWVYVENDAQVIAAFLALGYKAAIVQCEIILKKCGALEQDIQIAYDPIIYLVDTDESLEPLCIGVNYDFSKFKAIDLNFYGGSQQKLVASMNDVVTALQSLMNPGVTVSYTGCAIKLNKYGVGVPYENIEVCTWHDIHLVDTNEGISPCLNFNHDFSVFDQVDFSPYGGTWQFVYSNNDIKTKLEALIGANTVEISGCAITLKQCNIDLHDLEVRQTVKPEALLTLNHDLGNNYNIAFKALLKGTNGFEAPMDDGDLIQIIIPNIGINVKLVVGEDVLTASGYTDDIGSRSWATMIPAFIEASVVFDRNLLKLGTLNCNFNKLKFAYDQSLWGISVAGIVYNWSMKAIHGSDMSNTSSASMAKLWGAMMFDIGMLHNFAHCATRKKHSHIYDVTVTDFILPDDISMTNGFMSQQGDVKCDTGAFVTETSIIHPSKPDARALCSGCECDVEDFMICEGRVNLQNWTSLPQIAPAGKKVQNHFQLFESGALCFPHPHAVMNQIDTDPDDAKLSAFKVLFGVHTRFPARTDNANIKENRYWIGNQPGDSASSGSNRVSYKWTTVNNTDPNPQSFTGSAHTFPKEGIYNLYGEIELVTGVVDTWENEYVAIYSF